MQLIEKKTYLRSKTFDQYFIWGIAILGIFCASLVHFGLATMFVILTLDLYLLGYHHVIATFTRISPDKETLNEYRVALFYSFPIIVLTVAILFFVFDSWIITTIYLHWQWYHYTRQSEGISKAIAFKTVGKIYSPKSFGRFLFYYTPVSTFIAMSARQPISFLFTDVYTIPFPALLANFLLTLNIILIVYWLYKEAPSLKSNKTSRSYFSYLVSHHLIYFTAYVFIKDITIGWLAINIWHNLQYIAFVWHVNSNETAKGKNKHRKLFQWLTQENRFFIYFLACFTISFVIYTGIENAYPLFNKENFIVFIVLTYTTINFHHYIVDSVIWKLRKPKLQAALK